MSDVNLYAEREVDSPELMDHYCRHVNRMTVEGLHAKSDIAAELAWRDARIDALVARVKALNAVNARLREVAMHFLPVMESMRPLVLNLERLRDAAAEDV